MSKLPVFIAFISICGMTVFRDNSIVLLFFSLMLGISTGFNIIGAINQEFTVKHLMLIISLLITLTIMITYCILNLY